jgi:hypothetical protein
MLDQHAKTLIELMGKPFTPQGVIAAPEMALRLAQLQTALNTQPQAPDSDDMGDSSRQAIGLSQRAWPLIDMLTRADRKKVDVTWGVTI